MNNKPRFNLLTEFRRLFEIIKSMDRKVIIIFLSVGLLQTISWYFTSRRFFRLNLFSFCEDNPEVYLIEYLYWFIGDFVTFLILSVLIIKFILKEKINAYGFGLGEYRIGFALTIIFYLVMLPIIWFASSGQEFADKYPHLLTARTNWNEFFIFEAGMLLYMFAWEFIWRGFMLFGLKEKFGFYSVLIQMIPFVILHNGKPAPETFGAILGGIALGILALRTNSFYYGVITHMGVMFSIDLICTLRFRANDYGVGLNSLFHTVSKLF